jgi:hypothetical protein
MRTFTEKATTTSTTTTTPSGNLLHSRYGKWPIEIVDLLIKNGDFP